MKREGTSNQPGMEYYLTWYEEPQGRSPLVMTMFKVNIGNERPGQEEQDQWRALIGPHLVTWPGWEALIGWWGEVRWLLLVSILLSPGGIIVGRKCEQCQVCQSYHHIATSPLQQHILSWGYMRLFLPSPGSMTDFYVRTMSCRWNWDWIHPCQCQSLNTNHQQLAHKNWL